MDAEKRFAARGAPEADRYAVGPDVHRGHADPRGPQRAPAPRPLSPATMPRPAHHPPARPTPSAAAASAPPAAGPGEASTPPAVSSRRGRRRSKRGKK